MLKGITQQWSAKLAAVLLAVAGLVGGGILLAGSSTAAVADGQTCSASVKVTSAGGKTYVCAPGASDTTWRWRMVQGPKGATGAPGARGPQGVAGPKGAAGKDGGACPTGYSSVDLVVDDAGKADPINVAPLESAVANANAAVVAAKADVATADVQITQALGDLATAVTSAEVLAAQDALDEASKIKTAAQKALANAESALAKAQAALDAANAANARPDKVTIRACVKGASSATATSVTQARAPKHLGRTWAAPKHLGRKAPKHL